MNSNHFIYLCFAMVLFCHGLTDAVWTLFESSEFAVIGESFKLTCDPKDTSNFAKSVKWKKSGTYIATIEITNTCDVYNPDLQYQFTCEPGPVYELTIPKHVMTINQNSTVWKCESPFGGINNSAEYTLSIADPVRNINIQDDSNYTALNVIYENISKTFTCITNGCRPKANITVTTSGVTKLQRTEKLDKNSDGLIVTTVKQTIMATRGDAVKTIQCSALNIQGRQPVKSEIITLDIYYLPSEEPTLSGYVNGTVLYEGDNDLTLTCQQSGGYPLSNITWLCVGQTEIENNTISVASSYVQLTVDRNLNGKTCTCTIQHPYITTYTRTKSVIFTVYYSPKVPFVKTLGSRMPWVENSQGVLKCVTTAGYPSAIVYAWIQDRQVIAGQTTDTFTIPLLQSEHNGLAIQCKVSNSYTIQRPPAKLSNILVLNVQYLSKISLNKNPVVLSEGQNATRICSAIGNPKPTVNWYRNNALYNYGTGNSATLILNMATRNDSGMYICSAEAEAINGNQSHMLRSQESLQIYVYYILTNKPSPVCSSSDSISVSCCSVNNISRQLRFNGWNHKLGNTSIRTLEGTMISTNNNSLSLDYCGYYDSGIYTCQAAVDLYNNNTWQYFNSSIEVQVPSPPVISFSTVLDRDENDRRTMSVQFYSVPKPDIVEWVKDGETLTFSNKYQQITSVHIVTLLFYSTPVKVKGYESSLSTMNPVGSDFGTYTFNVENSKGRAHIKLQLNQKTDVSVDQQGEYLTIIIVGGVLGFITILCIIVAVICVYSKRHRRKNGTTGNQTKTEDQNEVKSSKSGNTESKVYQDNDLQKLENLGNETVFKDQNAVKSSEGRNTESKVYQEIDLQMYETLGPTCTTADQYESFPKQTH